MKDIFDYDISVIWLFSKVYRSESRPVLFCLDAGLIRAQNLDEECVCFVGWKRFSWPATNFITFISALCLHGPYMTVFALTACS